jgi:hypothetical protein
VHVDADELRAAPRVHRVRATLLSNLPSDRSTLFHTCEHYGVKRTIERAVSKLPAEKRSFCQLSANKTSVYPRKRRIEAAHIQTERPRVSIKHSLLHCMCCHGVKRRKSVADDHEKGNTNACVLVYEHD